MVAASCVTLGRISALPLYLPWKGSNANALLVGVPLAGCGIVRYGLHALRAVATQPSLLTCACCSCINVSEQGSAATQHASTYGGGSSGLCGTSGTCLSCPCLGPKQAHEN